MKRETQCSRATIIGAKSAVRAKTPRVHHIIPVRMALELACETWNMIVLCWSCHQSIIDHELDFRAKFQHLVDQSAPGTSCTHG
jgi:5-methylcytosine-specific restriction endonuclease McrA